MLEENRVFELKVGIFVFVGLIILSVLIFSIGDISFVKKGYNVNAEFDFVNGLSRSAPVRLAGVYVGEVRTVDVFFDSGNNKSRVKLDVFIENDVKIEKDAVARVNTLGLLGEKYLEISPGTGDKGFLSEGDTIRTQDPVAVEEVTRRMQAVTQSVDEIIAQVKSGQGSIGKLLTDDSLYNNFNELFASASAVMKRIESGEGTLGKMVTEDELYANLKTLTDSFSDVMVKLKNGEGTMGLLFTDQSIYRNLEEFTADIKENPWKLFHKK